ncbi:MAG: PRC and DUF2382 domain-containing protein [Catenulispora sp.]|nr:PRC and DUF2382 domain-containing protein [Catenulispora sp.]
MITREQVRTVIDSSVCDSDGNKIGKAKHVFLDDATGEPEWVSVKTGLFGSNETFVPIHGAAMVNDELQVPYPKDTVKDAPNVDVDAGGHLSVDEEHRLYDYYGIDWDGAWKQANQPGADGWAAGGAGTGTGTGMASGTAAATGTAAAAGAAGAAGMAAKGAGKKGADAKAGTAAGMARKGDDSMIRSEERMRVSTERRESGRARLRKYVVTEQQEQTVPLSHEEVRVVREPITEADRAAMSGAKISESEKEVTLHEERAVTNIETVPVERVRLDTTEVTEQETVRGTVRKEKIETDSDMDSDR